MIRNVFLRTEFNYDMDAASLESGLECKDVSMAQQQFAEESDINTIVERYGLNGELPAMVRAPQYGDFTGVSDFQSAMNAVNAARDSFMSLPAKVRSRFDNDPQQFLEFVHQDSNYDEARAMGLLEVLDGPAAVKVPGKPVNPVVDVAAVPGPAPASS